MQNGIQQTFSSDHETITTVFKILLQLKWFECKDIILEEFTSLNETITTLFLDSCYS